MNPSAQGWLKKLLKEISVQQAFLKCDATQFYKDLRKCGFIYGSNVSSVLSKYSNSDYSEEELTKLNLILSLIYVYNNSKKPKEGFTDAAIGFPVKVCP